MGNRFIAALIPADHGANASRPDVDNLGITGYELRDGRPYLSPEELVNTDVGPFGVPWWANYMALQTCQLFYATAPTPWQKGINYQYQATPLYTAGQAPIGQAPTSGVYTGVHGDGCS
jgi:hypothetical protein